MNRSTVLLKKAYYALNKRDIEKALATMHPEVSWPSGPDGACLQGHEEVRSFWTRQWDLVDTDVEPVNISEQENGILLVCVRQVIRDLQENLISDQTLQHSCLIEDGLIRKVEILQRPSALA